MKLLEHIKSKPSDVKAQYSALVAGIVTGAIAVVWVSTLPSRFAEIEAPSTDTRDSMDKLGELIGDTKEQLGNVVGTSEAVKTNVTTSNLDLIGAGKVSDSSTEPAIGDLFIKESEEETPATTPATTTGERRVLIETTKIVPRNILIGTSTEGSSE